MKNEIREIRFDGKEIITTQMNGKIYVAVKSVCDNLEMNANQFKNQKDKINIDELLKGGRKFAPLMTNGGIQEVMMLELDYLPIWLAKINPSRFSDELKEKLMLYQLKAKDILADEFLGKRKKEQPRLIEPVSTIQRNRDLRELHKIKDEVDNIRAEFFITMNDFMVKYNELRKIGMNLIEKLRECTNQMEKIK